MEKQKVEDWDPEFKTEMSDEAYKKSWAVHERREFIKQASIDILAAVITKYERFEGTHDQKMKSFAEISKQYAEALAEEVLGK